MSRADDRGVFRPPTTATRRDGVEGNGRLTGAAAALLLVLLAAEGATIPFVGPLLGPHIFIGVLLIPPVALKMLSTGYRFARYYAGAPSYRRKGPPSLPLRVVAPGVLVTTLALFGTGVWLLLEGPRDDTIVFLHKAAFVAWFGLMTLHVLGHLFEVPTLAAPDWRRGAGREAQLAGAGLRLMALGGSLLAGVLLGFATLSLAAPWLSARVGG